MVPHLRPRRQPLLFGRWPECGLPGGPERALSAVPGTFRNPNGVGLDADGNLYVADTDTARILRIAPDGTATAICGTGTAGFAGDGGPATKALIVDPFGLVVDAQGDVYFADGGNGRVRMIGTDGIITTVAGG